MQAVTQTFKNLSQGDLRPLKWDVRISFAKAFNNSITFFTIGSSLIGGPDFIPGTGDVVQEWDKYIYQDYSDRVIGLEWSREEDPFASVNMATADVILNNTDGYFTPLGGSPIDDYILPQRPIRISAGFGNEAIPQFIGLTDGMPSVNDDDKTVTFHCIDFLSSLLNRPLNDAGLFVAQRTDQILSGLFQLAGLSTAQFDFSVGNNIIGYAYFDKGTKLLGAVRKLIQVEQGRIYMDENGVITFRTRQSYDTTSVMSFNAYTNIIGEQAKNEDDIINVVEIKGKIREVQPLQRFWDLPIYRELPPGNTEVWASFQFPVTSVDDPEYFTDASTSSFRVNTLPDGTGDDSASVSLASSDIFSTSAKLVFNNPTSTALFLVDLTLFATPVIDRSELYIREQNDASVTAYDEKFISLENDFFQNESDAKSLALVALEDYANLSGVKTIDVKGTMALQVSDTISINMYDVLGEYKITRITNKLSSPAKYTQLLKIKNFTRRSYFTIGVSQIGGTDQIRP